MDKNEATILEGETGKQLDGILTPLLQEIVLIHSLPGLAIGIVTGKQIVYARGFGLKNLSIQEPVTARTIFHMASISKPFVATGLMQLVERGLVKLAAPVTTYLPYFKLDDPRAGDITIQQMLSHISGMPDVEDYEWDKPQYDEGALERYVRSLQFEQLLSNPGEKFAYSNMAFECLGDVVAKVSGISFDDYVKQQILNPAGMSESTFLKPEQLPESWAAPHVRILENLVWNGYPYNRMHGPSSTLHSNAIEMCQWAIANLNQGSFQGQRILNTASYDLLWKPRAEVEAGLQVGLSWFIGDYRGEKMIIHGGGDTGFRSQLALLPEKGVAVVLMCNLIPAPIREITNIALDIILGFEPTPIIPLASLPVFKTLQEKGLAAAAAHWQALLASYPDKYDFSPWQFYNLYNAVKLDRVKDAESIVELGVRVLPQAEVEALENYLKEFQNRLA
jgi:CubicO group peptidase (beta-lactamase class C family)